MAQTPAVAYLRTSSKTNVGEDKDSDRRQRQAVLSYARRAGLAVVHEVHDVVSGADALEDRPGFSALLDYVEQHQVAVVLVEDVTRLARALITQELGILALARRGLRVITSSGDDLMQTEKPTRTLMRQIAGAFAEYERALLVGRMRIARDRRSAEIGRRVEGRRSRAEADPELQREAKRLARISHKTGKRRSLRQIADELAAIGRTTQAGLPLSASQVGPVTAKVCVLAI